MPSYFSRRYTITNRPGGTPTGPTDPGSGDNAFAPPTDLAETPDAYEVRMELAGVDPEDVNITVSSDDQTVVIEGTRRASRVDGSCRYLNLEIQYGDFARVVRLTAPVDRDGATAGYDNGMLLIRLPKRRPSGQVRQVTIERGD